MSANYDPLIIDAGPAGLTAALAAAPSGVCIALIDGNPTVGGQIWRNSPRVNLPPRAHQMHQRLAGHADVEHFPTTRVIVCSSGRRSLLEDPQCGWQVDYRRLVLCTGTHELLLPFPDWTLPGITGADGLQTLAEGGLSLAGQHLVVTGSGPLLLASAANASQYGTRLLCVAEQAPVRTLAASTVHLPCWPGKLQQAVSLFARSYRADSYVFVALGEERLEAVCLREGGRVHEIVYERLACGFDLMPNVQLDRALGYHLNGQAFAVSGWQADSLPGHYAVGECTGFSGSELALMEDAIAGHVVVDERDMTRRLWSRRQRWQGFADTLARYFALHAELRELAEAGTLVCRCEDVPSTTLARHADWTEAKLHSRYDTGACQGRIRGSAA